VGQESPDSIGIDTGADGVAQTTLCGNGRHDFDEDGNLHTTNDCDDGNTVDTDDCVHCRPARCGDGIRKTSGTPPFEECDDGNAKNNDACVGSLCTVAVCGDGFIQEGVEECEPPNTQTCDANCKARVCSKCGDKIVDALCPDLGLPAEECDDGNHSDRDDCVRCRVARCGDGVLHTKGTPPFEECDDGNTIPGDGCSADCHLECGNGVLDGHCMIGLVNAPCSTDADCDDPNGAGNGVCRGDEECDPGRDHFCEPGPSECSDKCKIPRCGNGVRECEEQCDFGPRNGKGSCTADCKWATERKGPDECLHAWEVEDGAAKRSSVTCVQGTPDCDFDDVPGQCTFLVSVCFNKTGVVGCTPGQISSWDLPRLKLDREGEAKAAEDVAGIVQAVSPGGAFLLDRCARGAHGQVCTIPADYQCDAPFGAGNGSCDVGAGVLFDPKITATDRCTDSVPVVVGVGKKLVLRARVTRGERKGRDIDVLRLSCRS